MKKDTIILLIVICIVLIIMVGGSYLISKFPTPYQDTCENNDYETYNTIELEEGYVECCKRIYVDHKAINECKIFKVEKEDGKQ